MHNAGDTYLVLDGPSTASIKIKGSRFIAEALPVSDVSEAEQALASIRKRDYDATHHCSAWRIGKQGETFRYSDDGEPSSSAGLPIFRQIEGKELTNTMVVVIRYYGGTKLGTGGLVRAYGDAAKEALDAAPILEVIARTRMHFQFGYEDTSPAMHVISQFDAKRVDTKYGDDTVIILDVRSIEADAFADAIRESLSGRGTVRTE
ncbi:MAG: YigZ family protein [Bacteroidetes Order II. Incertae sedis bacterium]|nr:YigZ family protein [Bacteroidetes Order II. bacterium]